MGVDRFEKSELAFVAAAGEQNNATAQMTVDPALGRKAPGIWTIQDTGSLLTPQRGCVAVDEHTVRCSTRPGHDGGFFHGKLRVGLADMPDTFHFTESPGASASVYVDAHGGDDRVAVSAQQTFLDGGGGNDYLQGVSQRWALLDGGPGDDHLQGGPGDDVLIASRGTDYLDGEGGNDLLENENFDDPETEIASEPDIFVGGEGRDFVSYSERSRAVQVDLDDPEASAGQSGEGDRLAGIENVIGGKGDDVLAGDDGPNFLDGRGGQDRLIGRAGNDRFRLHPFGTGPGIAPSCGPGRDRIYFVGLNDFLAPDCETIHGGDSGRRVISAHPRYLSRGRLNYWVRCPHSRPRRYTEPFDPTPCSGAMRVEQASSRRRLIAFGDFPRGEWRNRTVTVRLTRVGEKLIARRNGVKAHTMLRVEVGPPQRRRSFTIGWTIQLQQPLRGGARVVQVAGQYSGAPPSTELSAPVSGAGNAG